MLNLLYVSKAKIDFNEEALEQLSFNASVANKELGITGYLYFERGNFLQYLEGEEHLVNALMEKIKKDPRHELQKVISTLYLAKKRFPRWNMQYLKSSELRRIKMETLIIDQLEFLQKIDNLNSNSDSLQAYDQIRIWNMVEKISVSNTINSLV